MHPDPFLVRYLLPGLLDTSTSKISKRSSIIGSYTDTRYTKQLAGPDPYPMVSRFKGSL